MWRKWRTQVPWPQCRHLHSPKRQAIVLGRCAKKISTVLHIPAFIMPQGWDDVAAKSFKREVLPDLHPIFSHV